jgi:Ca2+-dependent lipid-binding protein
MPATFSDLELKPVGLLEVKLVEARDLKNKDLVGKSDPFAVLYIRPLSAKTKKSKTIVSELRSSGELRESLHPYFYCVAE